MRAESLSQNLSKTVPVSAERPAWRDRKRYLWLLGTVVPLFLFLGWGLVNVTGLGLFWWIGPMVIYLVIPALDVVIGSDPTNPPDDVVAWLEQDRYYRWITYAFLPLTAVPHRTPGVSHDNPPHRRYHGAVVLGTGTRAELDDVIASPDVTAAIKDQHVTCTAVHAFAVDRTVPVIRTSPEAQK